MLVFVSLSIQISHLIPKEDIVTATTLSHTLTEDHNKFLASLPRMDFLKLGCESGHRFHLFSYFSICLVLVALIVFRLDLFRSSIRVGVFILILFKFILLLVILFG